VARRLAPIDFDLRQPRIVPKLVADMDVRADGRRLKVHPQLVTAGSIPAMVDLLLSERTLPAVVITASPRNNRPIVDANRIADTLAGLSHVFVVGSANATFALTDALGKQRSVFQGAVRLYWPGLSTSDSPYRHPLWLPGTLERDLSAGRRFHEFLFRKLAPITTLRTPIASLESHIRQALEAQRRAEVERLRTEARSTALDPEWQQELERAWRAEEHLTADSELLATEVERLSTELAAAQQNIVELSVGIRRTDEFPTAAPEPSARTVREAVDQAAASCEHLVFLPEAFDSAGQSPYRQPDKVRESLIKLGDVAASYHAGSLSSGIKEASRAAGLQFAGDISQTAKGKHRRDYERTYNSRKIMLGPHLVLGKGSPDTCLRIYFYIDEDLRAFVVGHVGRHLGDTTT
jgi:hypothetical protein